MAKTTPARPGLVAVLVYDGLHAFEFGIAWEAFGLPRRELDWWYDFVVVRGEPGPLRMRGGVALAPSAGIERLKKANTIVVPGWRDIHERPPEPMLSALRAAHKRGARLISLCSGAFVLAEAGLLDHRRATTHWYYAETFKSRFPLVQLESDVLYVDNDDVITSAGSAAGIDACLHVIRRDFGVNVANHIARALVVPPHREGGQAQYVKTPVHINAGRGLGEVMDWARQHLNKPISTTTLAKRAATSNRTLHRRFVESAGMTPKAWLLRERLHHAQELLETTDMALGKVAEACGFNSLETFRAAFRRLFLVSPSRFREQFRAQAGGTSNRLRREYAKAHR